MSKQQLSCLMCCHRLSGEGPTGGLATARPRLASMMNPVHASSWAMYLCSSLLRCVGRRCREIGGRRREKGRSGIFDLWGNVSSSNRGSGRHLSASIFHRSNMSINRYCGNKFEFLSWVRLAPNFAQRNIIAAQRSLLSA